MATNHPPSEPLQRISKDMRVVDVNGDDVGTVAFVHFNDPDAVTTNPAQDPSDGTFLQDFARAFTGDTGPDEEMQQRLLKQGFIRIEGGGLFGDDKYVASPHIADVGADVVHLSISKDAM